MTMCKYCFGVGLVNIKDKDKVSVICIECAKTEIDVLAKQGYKVTIEFEDSKGV